MKQQFLILFNIFVLLHLMCDITVEFNLDILSYNVC